MYLLSNLYVIRSSGKTIEAEDRDRADLSLPGHQLELLQDAASVGKPTILVLYNAGPVDISWANENVDAIMLNFLPGQSAGKAFLAVLTGYANPAGRLPYTWPVNMEQVGELEISLCVVFAMRFRPGLYKTKTKSERNDAIQEQKIKIFSRDTTCSDTA